MRSYSAQEFVTKRLTFRECPSAEKLPPVSGTFLDFATSLPGSAPLSDPPLSGTAAGVIQPYILLIHRSKRPTADADSCSCGLDTLQSMNLDRCLQKYPQGVFCKQQRFIFFTSPRQPGSRSATLAIPLINMAPATHRCSRPSGQTTTSWPS